VAVLTLKCYHCGDWLLTVALEKRVMGGSLSPSSAELSGHCLVYLCFTE
jgi:hypothetical protein